MIDLDTLERRLVEFDGISLHFMPEEVRALIAELRAARNVAKAALAWRDVPGATATDEALALCRIRLATALAEYESTVEAERQIERTREALAEAYARMWLRAAHRRDLLLFKDVEPDFEKWLEDKQS